MVTIPSGRLLVAPVGQISRQGPLRQCMQSRGKETRRTLGNVPCSRLMTRAHSVPGRVPCSALQAIWQAKQPMHRFRSMTMPCRTPSLLVHPHAGVAPHPAPGDGLHPDGVAVRDAPGGGGARIQTDEVAIGLALRYLIQPGVLASVRAGVPGHLVGDCLEVEADLWAPRLFLSQ